MKNTNTSNRIIALILILQSICFGCNAGKPALQEIKGGSASSEIKSTFGVKIPANTSELFFAKQIPNPDYKKYTAVAKVQMSLVQFREMMTDMQIPFQHSVSPLLIEIITVPNGFFDIDAGLNLDWWNPATSIYTNSRYISDNHNTIAIMHQQDFAFFKRNSDGLD